MGPIPQNGLNQACDGGTGTGLDEGSDSGGVEVFDLADEFDGPGELSGQKEACLGGIGGIGFAGGVGVNWIIGFFEGDPPEGFEEGFLGGGHGRTVESRRNGEPGGLDFPFFQEALGGFERFCRSGQDGLTGCVLVGDDQVEFFLLDEGRQFFGALAHGEHAARLALGLGHEATPDGREAVERFFIVTARSAKRDEFAVAVPGEGAGLNAEAFEDAPDAEAEDADGGLGHVGGAQGLIVGVGFFLRKGRVRENQVAETGGV